MGLSFLAKHLWIVWMGRDAMLDKLVVTRYTSTVVFVVARIDRFRNSPQLQFYRIPKERKHTK